MLRRFDTDITVLPIKYLDEMRSIPRHKLNGKKVQVNVSAPACSTWRFNANVLVSEFGPQMDLDASDDGI